MLAKNVIFTTDDESHIYYIPKDKISEWEDLFGYGRDGEPVCIPDWATSVEGETYVVDIKEKL